MLHSFWCSSWCCFHAGQVKWYERIWKRETAFQSYFQHRLQDKPASHTRQLCKPTQSNSASIPSSAVAQANSGMFFQISASSIQSTMARLSVKICHKHLVLNLDKGANEFVAFQENLEASFFTKLLLACCKPTKLIAMLHHDNMELMEWSQMTCCCLRCSTHSSDFHQRALWPSHLTPFQSSPHDFV